MSTTTITPTVINRKRINRGMNSIKTTLSLKTFNATTTTETITLTTTGAVAAAVTTIFTNAMTTSTAKLVITNYIKGKVPIL